MKGFERPFSQLPGAIRHFSRRWTAQNWFLKDIFPVRNDSPRVFFFFNMFVGHLLFFRSYGEVIIKPEYNKNIQFMVLSYQIKEKRYMKDTNIGSTLEFQINVFASIYLHT